MIIGFIICSAVAAVFLAIGIGCRKAADAAGFFAVAKSSDIESAKEYNNAVSILWFVSAGTLEIMGIPMLFLEQNSPLFMPVIFAVVILVIAMMIAYIKIEAKYSK